MCRKEEKLLDSVSVTIARIVLLISSADPSSFIHVELSIFICTASHLCVFIHCDWLAYLPLFFCS